MSAPPVALPRRDWPRLVGESLKQNGVWHTHAKLLEARRVYPDDLSLRGYVEIVRNTIVRDFLGHPRGLQAVPKLSADFLSNFDRFTLNAQEGYLVSLIDGRLDVQKLMILSPFDPFTTIFILAKLEHERAILVHEERSAMNFAFALSLLDQLPTSIAAISETGVIRYRNRAFDDAFGTDAKDWIREAARAVAGERGWLQGFFVDGADARTIDVEIEGRIFRIDRIMSVDDEEGSAVALAFEDVTRQRETEQQKSDFTAQIVHDLRGPLSGIQGTLEFVLSQEGAKLESLYSDLLQEAYRETERMMNLINEILDFSKIQSGNFVVESEPVRVAGVLKRAVRSLQSVASRDEIFLLSAHGRDIPQIIGSVEKLTQAVINLISNSLKFTPKKGLISVGAQIVRNGDMPEAIVITVTDTGAGINAEDLEKIFQKYKQSGKKSLRGGGGTGLGLYIVKQVVEAHGGEVSVASVEGVGTSMVLRLPVKRAA